jgi:DNA-directed RNA polymerase subunit omega
MARVSIEDCLKNMENRFALVAVASHRTRELMSGKTPLVKAKNKEAVIALREIANGLVGADRSVAKEIDKISSETDPLT